MIHLECANDDQISTVGGVIELVQEPETWAGE